MKENILKLKDIKAFKNIVNTTENHFLTNVNIGYVLTLIALDFLESEKSIFVVLPNLTLAQKFYDELCLMLPDEEVLFYPADEFLTSILSLASLTFKTERIYTLGKILKREKKIIILNQAAAMYKTLDKDAWEEAIIEVKEGKRFDLENLTRKLVNIGYKREYTVLKTGEFSIRGSIMDIFPIGYENPFRIDFFDIEVDTIKIFEPETQLSIGKISEFNILPLNELFFNDEKREKGILRLEKHLEEHDYNEEEKEILNHNVDELYQKINLDIKNEFICFFTEKDNTIFDFTDNKRIYFFEPDKMYLNEERMIEDIETYDFIESGKVIKDISFYKSVDELLAHNNNIQVEMLDTLIESEKTSIYARDVINYEGNDHILVKELKEEIKTNVINISSELRYQKLIDTLELNKIKYFVNPKTIKQNEVNIFYPNYIVSFNLYKDGYNVIHEKEIYDYRSLKRHIKYKSVLTETVKISHIDELTVGDYVVHYDHGIGRYEGIKTMVLSGVTRDYIHIAYAGTDYLYIPVDQVDLILKYSSSEGFTPQLNRIGTKQWANVKKRVKQRLTDISDKLLSMYQERLKIKGFAHLKEDKMHEEFASFFPYVETKDQQKAINETIADMELDKPMDRLIIGDVGYGKTEVALRASFKAVYSGKQVAYLVPTTLLARQHYHVYKERFEPFGIKVELLSRFVTPRKQKELLKNLKEGKVDIVVGTHRLLSDDVGFKDLGLLIIDEEQRFGVRHKEKIKELKINVDTLSLTATPIPRTLQMALTGIKDLSMIETPPLNRYPVQTHIIERHPVIIKEAILKEVARGGQVFYLYNRVIDMEMVVLRLKELLPNVKIAYAHGQMRKDKLERIIVDFIDKKYDVLVSTTIIETGIDIPNTNTLLVHNADYLGLSQLYQIRGRVGRSDKIAYAYLMYDRNKKLTPEAEARLKTIKDFQQLGSGFKIAMRDLSIRGAGNLLGEEQSGFIESVGLEMYLKLLEEVVDEQKGIKKEKVVDDETILSKRQISKEYISNDEVRLEIHKRIADVNNLNDITNLIIELEDRFGFVDNDLKEYMYEKLFYKLANEIGVEKIDKTSTDITLIISEEKSKDIDGLKLFTTIEETGYQINLKYIRNNIHITLVYDGTKENYLYQINNYLTLVLQ
ncbi:MAG: transcription-repair coupling factor [Acholeplasmatales bacterium]